VLASPVRRLLPGLALFELGNLATPLLILRATELMTPVRGGGAATTAALLLYALHNLAAALVSFPAGRMADRYGSVVVLAGGVSLFALSYAGLAVTGPSIPLLAAAFITAGAAIGCVETAEHAAVAAHAPEEVRGSAFGLLAGIQSFGNLVASGVAGLLWTLVSPRAAFSFAAALMVLSGAGLLHASGMPTHLREER
jgi:MFS family permease